MIYFDLLKSRKSIDELNQDTPLSQSARSQHFSNIASMVSIAARCIYAPQPIKDETNLLKPLQSSFCLDNLFRLGGG